jgi:hypothetical protein
MTAERLVTREVAGHGPDGPVYARTWTGRPRPPESLGEWAGQRVAALGEAALRGFPATRVTVALLEALAADDSAAAVRAAVAAGRDLDDQDRYAVLATLEICRDKTREYPPSSGPMRDLVAAWVRKHGDKQPRRTG